MDKIDTEWQERASCLDMDPELFFAEDEYRVSKARTAKEQKAKAVCARCPVSGNCLDTALMWPDTCGVWGGTTREERVKISRVGKRASCVRCRGRNTALVEGAQVCVGCGLSWLVSKERKRNDTGD